DYAVDDVDHRLVVGRLVEPADGGLVRNGVVVAREVADDGLEVDTEDALEGRGALAAFERRTPEGEQIRLLEGRQRAAVDLVRVGPEILRHRERGLGARAQPGE